MQAPEGRVLMWGWLQESADPARAKRDGFAGALSLPRTVELAPDGLRTAPVAELAGAFSDGERQGPFVLSAGERRVVGAASAGYRLRMSLTLGEGTQAEVQLVGSPPSGDPPGERIVVRALRAPGGRSLEIVGESAGVAAVLAATPLPAGDGPITVEVFVDGTVVEVFPDSGTPLTTRMYPAEGADLRPQILVTAGCAEFAEVDVARFAARN
jgi:beta-fructofuranosidase